MPDFTSDAEMQAVRAEFNATLACESSPLIELGGRTLARISPPSWTLEWYLPRWLGETFSLSREISYQLVLCNVFGLAFIRVQDDLVDGEVKESDQSAARALANLFYQQAIQRYGTLFETASPFWNYLEARMGEWRRAMAHDNASLAKDFSVYDENDFLRLAQRAAPLKICCAAACLLSQHAVVLRALTSAIDHAMVGAVLLDHMLDWEKDLAAGRWNTFVAYHSALLQSNDHKEENCRAVLQSFLIGDAASCYFDLIEKYLTQARGESAALRIQPLAEYLASFAQRAQTYRESLRHNARVVLSAATDLLFGAPAVASLTEKGG